MNKKELVSEGYEAPRVEVIEVEVEQGFVASPNGFPLHPDDPLG